jgi:hypothetical protein
MRISKSRLYEDDNPASITKGGLIRLYEFDAKSRKTLPNTPIYWILLHMNPSQKKPLRSMVYQHQYSKDQLLVERSYPQERKPAL